MLRRRPVTHDPGCTAQRTVLGAVVCANGVRQPCEFCEKCGRRSSSYGKAELLAAGVDPAGIQVVADYRTDPCAVCGSLEGVEVHHWACQTHEARFRDASIWPVVCLCRTCHAEWHRAVTPELVAGSVTLGELGARRGMTVRELMDALRDWITAKKEAA